MRVQLTLSRVRWAQAISLAAAAVAAACLALLILRAAPAFAEGCPNEAIRTSASSDLNPTTGAPYDAGLPECRAYEKVSPDYKQSANVETTAATGETAMAPDGGAIAWKSVGNFEGEGSLVGGNYLSRRTDSGWVTANVTAPARLVPGLVFPISQTVPGFTSDLSQVLWCRGQGDSAEYASQYNVPNPSGCAIRGLDGEWQATPSLRPINNYANVVAPGFTTFSEAPKGASADFSHLFFSTALRLLPGDTAQGQNTTLYEWVNPTGLTPQLRIVNVDNNGALIGSPDQFPIEGGGAKRRFPFVGGVAGDYQAVSADGGTVFFTTVPDDGVETIFARRYGTTTTTVSDPSPPQCTTCNPTPKNASYIGASSDGERVFFLSDQQLLDGDTDSKMDLYEYDFEAPSGHNLVQVSAGGPGDLSPGTGAEVQGVLKTSEDGSHAYFVARGVLTTIPNPAGQVPTAGAENLYVFERDARYPTGRTRFIATLPAGEIPGLTNINTGLSQVTPDGRYLVFTTAARLITSGPEADTDSATDVYFYDAQEETLRRISVGEPAYPASDNGNTPGMNAVIDPTGIGSSAWAMSGVRGRMAISDDGSYVVFDTAEKLQADDVNGGDSSSTCKAPITSSNGCDVYLWHDGVVSLISPGQHDNAFQGGRVSASGSDVFFTSANQLVPQDRDANVDIYDARVNGGFPYTPPSPPCLENEACHGQAASIPTAPVAASSTFTGPGNQPRSQHKKKHHKKKHHKKKVKGKSHAKGKSGGSR